MSNFGQSTSYQMDCDVAQGFNFDKSNPNKFGFVETLKIGDLELPTDFSLVFPDEDSEKPVVGVVRDFFWDGQKQSPLEFQIQVSLASKQKLELLVHKEMKKEDVSIKFRMYDFDSGEPQAFYLKFHSLDAAVKGVVKKEKAGNGVKRCISIDPRQSTEVAEPKNFLLTLYVDPQGKQELGAASSATDKWVETWGMD